MSSENRYIDYTNKIFKDRPVSYIWYSLRTFEKQEKKAADNFMMYLKDRKIDENLIEIFTPKQTVMVVRRGKNITEERNFYPGHVFICIDAEHDITPEISQFLLKKGKLPCKFSQAEIDKIKSKVSETTDTPKTSVDFEVGSRVRIISGLYTDMRGLVDSINVETASVVVKLDIFGGSIPAEVSLLNVASDE